MLDTTIVESVSEPSQDSAIFGCLSQIVFKSVLDVVPVLAAVLNWSPLARSFLVEVLRQLPDGEDVLELRHSEFAAILWPGSTVVAGQRRIGRAVHALKQDQALSGFQAVWVEPGCVVEVDGQKEYQPTTYRLRDFYLVFDDMQRRAAKADVLALPIRQRRAQLRAIAHVVCKKRKYQAVPARARQQKSKAATASEAAGAEPGGITVARAMHELQQMPRSDQFEFAKDFTETVTSFLISDSQDYDEGQHIFTKMQTAAMIGGAHSLDDLRQRIARLNKRGVIVKPGVRAAALRQCLDDFATILAKCEQLELLCEASDVPEVSDYLKRWIPSLRDLRWAINEERKGRVAQEVS